MMLGGGCFWQNKSYPPKEKMAIELLDNLTLKNNAKYEEVREILDIAQAKLYKRRTMELGV